MSEITQPIPARLKNVAVNGHVAGAADIIDDSLNRTQAVINAMIDEVLGDGGNVAFIDDDDPGQAVDFFVSPFISDIFFAVSPKRIFEGLVRSNPQVISKL